MTQKETIELLAPAGSVTGLRAVIAAGADAVYIGGSRFGARAYAENPKEDDLLSAIDYAHLRGVKVYLTVNTLLKNSEMDSLYEYLLPYYMHGIDAVLVQDFGVLRYLHRVFADDRYRTRERKAAQKVRRHQSRSRKGDDAHGAADHRE